MSGPGRVLLMRHAHHDDGVLTGQGWRELDDVIRTLEDTLRELQRPAECVYWLPPGAEPSPEVEATVAAVGDRLGIDVARLGDDLCLPGPYDAPEVRMRRIGAARTALLSRSDGAFLVGNDPGVSWLAADLGGIPVPMARSEVVCLVPETRWWRRHQWRLDWSIAPTDAGAADALRTKIQSKMDVAKVFGGLVAALIAFVLGVVVKDGRATVRAVAAACAIGAGGVLYLQTLYAYDRLLMPVRFWAGKPAGENPLWLVRRPPSSDAWVLYQNMIRAWRWLFLPATMLVALGLVFLGWDALQATPKPGDAEAVELWVGLAGVGAVTIFSIGWWAMFRPRLGVQD